MSYFSPKKKNISKQRINNHPNRWSKHTHTQEKQRQKKTERESCLSMFWSFFFGVSWCLTFLQNKNPHALAAEYQNLSLDLIYTATNLIQSTLQHCLDAIQLLSTKSCLSGVTHALTEYQDRSVGQPDSSVWSLSSCADAIFTSKQNHSILELNSRARRPLSQPD